MTRFIIPLCTLLILLVFLAIGLTLNPRDLPSPLINQPAPAFTAPLLTPAQPQPQPQAQAPTQTQPQTFSPTQMRGEPWLLNIWASWCVACRTEHEYLIRLAETETETETSQPDPDPNPNSNSNSNPNSNPNSNSNSNSTGLPIVGLNYKDNPTEARAWLKRHGNPYAHTPTDPNGDIAIDYGVYGVPETYLIDAHGRIRFKQVGPLTPQIIQASLLPLLAQLRTETTPSPTPQ